MSDFRVIISAPYMIPVVDRFIPRLEARGIRVVVPPVRERLEEDDLVKLIPGVHGVICGDDRFTEKVFEAADELRVISKWGTGIDSIDADAAARNGVRVCRTPGAFTIPVADSVFMYCLAHARRLTETLEDMRAGGWQKLSGVTLSELTIGIVGFGDIGTEVAKRAVAFDMSVLVCDVRDIDEEVAALPGVVRVSHEHLFQQADIVTLHCDLNPSSVHLVDKAMLSRMKPDALLINTARGPVVHEEALVVALQNGNLAGAGLDVFEHEPLAAESPLRSLPNVLLAPHNANSSPRAWKRVHLNTVRNLLEGLGLNGDG